MSQAWAQLGYLAAAVCFRAALKGLSLLARTASLVAHLQEESERPIGFILSGAAAAAIDYDGLI